MSYVLLKPHFFTLKNRFILESKRRFLNRDLIVIAISLLIVYAIYFGTASFLSQLRAHPQYDAILPARLMSICFLAFFMLLLFSNSIAALGYLFSAKDLPLLLSAPVAGTRLYFSRLLAIIITSSWMFLLFSLPALVGYYEAMDLPWTFLPHAFLLIVPFLLIPASLGVIFIVLFVNIIPPHRIRDILVVLAFVIIAIVLYINHGVEPHLSTEEEKLNDLFQFLYFAHDPQPVWSPARWITQILSSYTSTQSKSTILPTVLLLSSALGTTSLGFLLFDSLFHRGWSKSMHSRRTLRVYETGIGSLLGRILIPFSPQLRALCFKEARTFIRDTVQSLQLLMLLMLTFIYLYNFRSLRVASNFNAEGLSWWQVILSIANVSFGACVVSAIATRFVFPSISLEGRAYHIVRSTPLSIPQLLRYKFFTWYVPMSILCAVLLVSGSLAIQANLETILATFAISFAISGGITGLAIGIGAVYSSFDWDSPSQVTASFGSLVYMLLAIGTIIVTIIPCAFIYVLTCVPTFVSQMSERDYLVALACSAFLVVAINLAAAKRAISAGTVRLRDLEK